MPLQRDLVRPPDGYVVNPFAACEYSLDSPRGALSGGSYRPQTLIGVRR
jgi:hypothetical protein